LVERTIAAAAYAGAPDLKAACHRAATIKAVLVAGEVPVFVLEFSIVILILLELLEIRHGFIDLNR
jgi:hypothetical protein